MTKEEAIKVLNGILHLNYRNFWDEECDEAIEMAIESLSTDTVSREAYHNLVTASNDIDRALREYQDKEENGELVSVVRCKDCEDSRVYGKTTKWLACESVMEGQATDPDGYCYLGKKKKK